MRKIIYVATALIVLSSCNKKEENQNQVTSIEQTMKPIPTDEKAPKYVPKGDLTEMTFDKMEHDFGIINHPDKVNYSFKFTNTGNKDLIISKAVGSCGCTVPEYPKEPIKPGESGKIKVVFKSAGKNGEQHKTVTLLVNTKNGTEKLHIRAMIKGGREKKKRTATPNLNLPN